MNEQWQQPAPLWVRAAPLALVVVGIVVVFVCGEFERAKEKLDEDLGIKRIYDEIPVIVEVATPHLTSDHWQRIASLKSLRGVNLRAVESMDEGVELVTSLPALESLAAGGQTVFDDALIQRLAAISTLKRLYLNNCGGVTDESIDVLIGWKSLDTVLLNGTSVTFDGLMRLRAARRDLCIRADWLEFPPAAGDRPVAIHSSGGADFTVVLHTPAGMGTFRRLLDVPHNWRTGRWQDQPRRQIESLDVYGEAAGPALPELAAELTHVKSLTVQNTRIAGNVGKWSDELKSLQVWNIAEGSDLSGFAGCPSLTSIHLDGRSDGFQEKEEEVVVIDLQWLGELPALEELFVSKLRITPADVESISRLDALETVYLDNLSGESIGPLLVPGRLPNLKVLGLGDFELDADMQAQLRSAYPAATIQGRGFYFTAADSGE